MIAPGSELPVQRHQRHLGGMLDGRELRLAEEHLADGEPVKAADQPPVLVPHLDRMSIAGLVRLPKARMTRGVIQVSGALPGRGCGAGLDHPGEVLIHGDA